MGSKDLTAMRSGMLGEGRIMMIQECDRERGEVGVVKEGRNGKGNTLPMGNDEVNSTSRRGVGGCKKAENWKERERERARGFIWGGILLPPPVLKVL